MKLIVRPDRSSSRRSGASRDALPGRDKPLGRRVAKLLFSLGAAGLFALGASGTLSLQAQAQTRTTDDATRITQTPYGERQRALIADLEARAKAWANGQAGSSKYWAYIEANLRELSFFDRQSGERMAGAPAPAFRPPTSWPSDADKAYQAAVAAHVDKLKNGERIFGGERAVAGQFPEVVSLAIPLCSGVACSVSEVAEGHKRLTSFHSFCTGTLVSKKAPDDRALDTDTAMQPHVVLTAAHCLCDLAQFPPARIQRDQFVVVFGTRLRELEDVRAAYRVFRHGMKREGEPRTASRSEHQRRCNGYNNAGNWTGRDLAMVQLGERLSVPRGAARALVGGEPHHDPPVAPVAAPALLFSLVPDAPQVAAGLAPKPQSNPGEVVLVGYGYTEQIVGVNRADWLTGTKYHARVFISEAICTQGHDSGCSPGKELVVVGNTPSNNRARADTCSGDSGGPVFLLDKLKRRYLIAATSRAAFATEMQQAYRNDPACGTGGIYSLVTPQAVTWLRGQDANLILCSGPGFCADLRE